MVRIYFFHTFAKALTQINHYTSRTYIIIYIYNKRGTDYLREDLTLHSQKQKTESKTKGLKQKLKAE